MLSVDAVNRIIKLCDQNNLNNNIRFKKLHPDAKAPVRAKRGDAGYDLTCVEHVTLHGSDGTVSLKTGIAIELPDNMFAQIAPRSGLGKKGMIIHGGIIDAGYRGEIIVLASKAGNSFIDFQPGDKVAQLIILPKIDMQFVETQEELSQTDRGENGFGSTDNLVLREPISRDN